MAQRRATIFAFFCSFAEEELAPLVQLQLAPIAAVGAADVSATDAETRDRAAALATVPAARQLGVLRSLHEAVAQLGPLLARYLCEVDL